MGAAPSGTAPPSPTVTSTSRAPAPTTAPGPITESRTLAPRPTTAPAMTTEPETSAPGLDHRARHDGRPVGDPARDRRALLHADAVGAGADRRRRRRSRHHVAGGRDERLRRSDVAPVGVLDVADDHGPRGDERREGLALDRHHPPGRDQVDDPAPEHVAAGVHLVAHRLLGLLDERQHPAALVGGDAAEGAGVRHLDQVERHVDGPAVPVPSEVVELRDEVVSGQHVPVEDHHRAVRVGGEGTGDVADRARGSQRLLLGDVAEPEAEPRTVAEDGPEQLGAVGRGQHDVRHPRCGQLGDLVLEERHTADLQQVLGPVRGEREHPGAEPAGDDDRLRGRGAGRGSRGGPRAASCHLRTLARCPPRRSRPPSPPSSPTSSGATPPAPW